MSYSAIGLMSIINLKESRTNERIDKLNSEIDKLKKRIEIIEIEKQKDKK